MKLFWAPQTRSQRAIWMLEEAGLEYDMELIDIRSPNRKDSREFLAASPMGKVPALVDGTIHMSESAAICMYIADRYAPGELAPTVDDPDRGKFLYWTLYTPSVVEPAMSEKYNDVKANRSRSGWGDFGVMITTLDDGLEGKEWIVGDRFTAADVMLGSSAIFMRMFEMLPENRNIDDYADRCMERPAHKIAMEKAQA